MIGVKSGVKNDLGYSFGLNGIQGKWRAQGDDFRTFLNEFVSSVPQAEVPIGRLVALDDPTIRPSEAS